MNFIPYNIPRHTRCINCGECCGPVPINESEYRCIKNYVDQHPEVRDVVNAEHQQMECVFRDNSNKRCAIYPVRPMVCRLFGVIDEMKCPNGNSASVKGVGIDFNEEIIGIQNSMQW